MNEWLSLRVDALSRRSGRLVGVKLVCDMREADPLKQFRFCCLTLKDKSLCTHPPPCLEEGDAYNYYVFCRQLLLLADQDAYQH